MANLAIIPARGGSKRIPGKNTKLFHGKPILAYSIEAAIDSDLFDEVMVSTDDPEIASLALTLGAKVPFLRSDKNADDYAVLSDVIGEVISLYRQLGKVFANFCCILPTAPFVRKDLLLRTYKQLTEGSLDTVFPVLEFSFPIQRSLKMEGQRVQMVNEEYLNMRSQDLPARYHDAGQFYWGSSSAFEKNRKLFTANSGGIVISAMEAQDIDTNTDWKLAELKYQMLNDVSS